MACALQSLVELELHQQTGTTVTWGGARNRAGRVSWHLTVMQVKDLIDAAMQALAIGLPFNRHWTIHYERAGIAEQDAVRFIGKLLHRAGQEARRFGGQLAAIWVRENGPGKGGHVHILLHLPVGMKMQRWARRWVVTAGGKWRAGVSKTRSIAGNLTANVETEYYRENVGALLAYVLKGADTEAGSFLNLDRFGKGGEIVGKRCGRTNNLGPA